MFPDGGACLFVFFKNTVLREASFHRVQFPQRSKGTSKKLRSWVETMSDYRRKEGKKVGPTSEKGDKSVREAGATNN